MKVAKYKGFSLALPTLLGSGAVTFGPRLGAGWGDVSQSVSGTGRLSGNRVACHAAYKLEVR